ncbi:MAG: hypothetical protein ACI97B_003870, partial [Verrucomicrobiales bacterium]
MHWQADAVSVLMSGMIVVISDDLSGAAELAGAAAARGLNAEVQLSFKPVANASSKPDLIAISSNSRGCSPHEAAMAVEQTFRDVCAFHPDWIFKKVDSVLRGHVVEELRAALSITGQSRALLIPVNPTQGQMIRDGIFYHQGEPLYKSDFAMDPKHPVMSSEIVRMLAGSEDTDILVIGGQGSLPDKGLVIPDAGTSKDLGARAEQVDVHTLAAGGVEFFEALLDRRWTGRASRASDVASAPNPVSLSGPITGRKRTLFVCGSKTAWDHGCEETCSTHNVPLVLMPSEFFGADFSSHEAHAWAESIVGQLDAHHVMMLAIGDYGGDLPFQENVLVTRLAEAIRELLSVCKVDRLFMEGGATAAAILSTMHWM